jgi:hypothetical protein
MLFPSLRLDDRPSSPSKSLLGTTQWVSSWKIVKPVQSFWIGCGGNWIYSRPAMRHALSPPLWIFTRVALMKRPTVSNLFRLTGSELEIGSSDKIHPVEGRRGRFSRAGSIVGLAGPRARTDAPTSGTPFPPRARWLGWNWVYAGAGGTSSR